MPVVACKLVARTCALLFIQRFATNPLRWGANFTKTIKNMKNQDFSKKNSITLFWTRIFKNQGYHWILHTIFVLLSYILLSKHFYSLISFFPPTSPRLVCWDRPYRPHRPIHKIIQQQKCYFSRLLSMYKLWYTHLLMLIRYKYSKIP